MLQADFEGSETRDFTVVNDVSLSKHMGLVIYNVDKELPENQK